MKSLKITLMLVAVSLLTVSSIQTENRVVTEEQTVDKNYKIDLLAHGKKKLQIPTQG